MEIEAKLQKFLDDNNLEIIKLTDTFEEDDLILFTSYAGLEVHKYNHLYTNGPNPTGSYKFVVRYKYPQQLVFKFDEIRYPKKGELFLLGNAEHLVAKQDYEDYKYPVYVRIDIN